jgi:hypothetical protein
MKFNPPSPVPSEPTTAVDPVLLDHPLFQQLVKECAELRKHCDGQAFVLETLAGVFRECGVATEAASPEASTQALRNHLNDAQSLYRVMRGETKASALLAEIEKLIAPEVFGAIVLDLSIFLAPRLQKLVEELSSSATPAIAAAMLATGLKRWEAHQPIFERRMLTVQQLERKVHELCTHAGISDPVEMQSIESEISRVIGRDVLVLAQVESGDFAEVERLFADRFQGTGKSIQ